MDHEAFSGNTMLKLLESRVEPDWVDYNGHMNVAYYHMAFDRATDHFLDELGLGEDYAKSGAGSMFALEDHITYRRELRQGDPFRITLQLLDYDTKRIHYFLRMYHSELNALVATCEHLSIYVDFGTRRSRPLPEAVRVELAKLYERHHRFPRPEEAGRPIAIRRA
ncbi:MAG: thioesterase family protein [Acidobacteriota bacterium]